MCLKIIVFVIMNLGGLSDRQGLMLLVFVVSCAEYLDSRRIFLHQFTTTVYFHLTTVSSG